MPVPDNEHRYEELRLQLLQAVSRICPQWLVDSKEDIAHAAMIKVMRDEQKSEGNRPFNPHHVRRICYCVLVDEIRRRRSRREVPIEERVGEVAETRGSLNPGSIAAAREIERGILDCIDRLARPRRIAVTLYLLGYSVPQLAQLVRWTPKKAENLVYRGLANLRDCLASRGLKP